MKSISRRGFLGAAVAAGAGTALGYADVAGAGASAPPAPFHGAHQAGVLEPAAPAVAVVSFDVIAASRPELDQLLRTLSDRARLLTGGGGAREPRPGFTAR